MGSNYSKNVNEQYNENVIDFSQDLINRSVTRQDVQLTNVQKSNITLDNTITDGSICNVQNIDSSINMVTDLSGNFENDLENTLKNSFNGLIENTTEQTNEGLNLFQFNTSVNESSTTNINKSNFSQSLSNTFDNIVKSNLFNSQSSNITLNNSTIGSSDGKCSVDVSQTIHSDSVFDSAINNAAVTTAKNDLENSTEMEIKNLTTQLNKGVCLECLLVLMLVMAILMAIGPGALKFLIPKSKKSQNSYVRPKKQNKNKYIVKLLGVLCLGIILTVVGFYAIDDSPPAKVKTETETNEEDVSVEGISKQTKSKVVTTFGEYKNNIKIFFQIVGILSILISIFALIYIAYDKKKKPRDQKFSHDKELKLEDLTFA